MRRRKFFQKLAVVGQVDLFVNINVVKRVSQGHIAVFVMMAVGLAVSGNVHQLRPSALAREAAFKALGKIFTAIEQMLKRHSLRNRPIIKKEVELCSRWQFDEVSACGINAAA